MDGIASQFAKLKGTSRRLVNYFTVLRFALLWRHLPPKRGSRDQPLACTRACLLQINTRLSDGPARRCQHFPIDFVLNLLAMCGTRGPTTL
jgi:hypothetical protein